MITIRREQAAAFAQHQMAQFENWMIIHIKTYWPKQFADRGESAMRRTVQDGVGLAAGYGFTSERDVCKYIDLMVAFGPGFDRLHWAKEVLGPRETQDAAIRMDRLCLAALSQPPGGE